jgi:hypothetical protein
MNDYNDGSRRRERHGRRHRRGDGRDGANEQRNQGSRPAGQAQAPARDIRHERREELPPLPKLPTPVCSRCGQPIQDITSALADKGTGAPVHFDCVINFLTGAENLGTNEKIVYIGQGRFAVMFFENPQDTKKFRIVRTIDWESRETKAEWRADIAGAFSQVK